MEIVTTEIRFCQDSL